VSRSDVEPATPQHSCISIGRSNWQESFTIPWGMMDKSSMDCMRANKRPTPSDRRKMVRVVVDGILAVSSCPVRKQVAVVAHRMMCAFPESLTDKLNGDVVGTGYNSLLEQLMRRVENLRRPVHTVSSTTQGNDVDDAGALDTSLPDDAAVGDRTSRPKRHSYGCSPQRWLPTELPPNETNDTQLSRKTGLKAMHISALRDTQQVQCVA
jgi:hypothetical protein